MRTGISSFSWLFHNIKHIQIDIKYAIPKLIKTRGTRGVKAFVFRKIISFREETINFGCARVQGCQVGVKKKKGWINYPKPTRPRLWILNDFYSVFPQPSAPLRRHMQCRVYAVNAVFIRERKECKLTDTTFGNPAGQWPVLAGWHHHFLYRLLPQKSTGRKLFVRGKNLELHLFLYNIYKPITSPLWTFWMAVL